MHQGVLTLNSSGLIVHAYVVWCAILTKWKLLNIQESVVYILNILLVSPYTTGFISQSEFEVSSEHCQSTYFMLPNLWVQLYSCLYSLNIRRFVYRCPHMLLVRAFSHILSSRRVCLVDHTSALLSGAWAVLWKDCLHSVLLLPSGASVQQTSPHQLKENWGDWLPLQYSRTETGTFARSCWRLCSL